MFILEISLSPGCCKKAKVTDTGGALVTNWVQLLDGPGYQLALNGSGVYLSGYFEGTARFGDTILGSARNTDGF